jgi:hypothetical protein
MVRRLAAFALLAVMALACAPGWADDHKPPSPAEDPDPSFLEFLGSVDRLAEVNPDYLTPAARPPGAAPPKAAPPPPPPPPPPSPPSPSQARVSSND